MAKATHERLALPLDALICHYAGIETSDGELPIAAITCLGEDMEVFDTDSKCHLIFAEPVHLLLQRDSFCLSGPVPLPLSLDESTSLIASLNQHFHADGLEFILTNSSRWYLRLDRRPEISTSHPMLAINRDINAFLPKGKEAGKWRQLINEIQMLLFSHPVNQSRELADLPLCNSLWFWGEGQLPEKQQLAVAKAYASTAFFKGLGRLGYVELVDSAAAILADSDDQPLWLVLNEAADISEAAICGYIDMLKSGQVGDLQLHYGVGGQILRSRLTRTDLWKFWRRSLPMQAYFPEA